MDKQQGKRTVLIVDDTGFNRAILADILAADYQVLEAGSGEEAAQVLEARWGDISLVLLDVVMPGMGGFGLLELMGQRGWLQSIPVIMISADNSQSNIDRAFDLGATDYLYRDAGVKTVRHRVENTINLYGKQKTLENLVADQIMEKERSNFQMVEVLSNIVEFRNGESGLHVRHVRLITDILLQAVRRRCPEYGLTSARIAVIANASALHDIGKISIDEKILNKPARLTPEEFEIMKTHTVIGAKMLEETPREDGEDPDSFLRIAHDICRWHHERWDGRGYPDGLTGDQIPISAQVVALADVYDALTSPRVYKPAIPADKALEMIKNGECGAFNPVLLDCLCASAGRLSRELDSAGGMNATEIRRMAGELLARGGLNAASRTMILLEQERSKFQFYAALTGDILFEYDRGGHCLSFPGGGGQALGLKASVAQPDADPQVLALGRDAMDDLRRRLEGATALEPDVSAEYILTLPGGPRRFRVEVRTLWDGEDRPSYAKVVGKLTALAD